MGGRGASSGNTIKDSRFKNAITNQIENKKTTTNLNNKENLFSYIKQQTKIDLSKVEEKDITTHSRTGISVHLEALPINDRNTVKTLLNKRGIRTGDNGGLGTFIYFEKKKK